ncbi:hypothetical protein KIN20_024138 [Parelaphostrongylus tenuis]|uniref:Uncharacterized protein n=1 Tax=Parelaphostrongylus tenuis TaxID=148309 RepID=A0AAD5QW48_PARTN|nr:hypothetical protein KIN20_024138 [Parelaphostrongylus tenuis]
MKEMQKMNELPTIALLLQPAQTIKRRPGRTNVNEYSTTGDVTQQQKRSGGGEERTHCGRKYDHDDTVLICALVL